MRELDVELLWWEGCPSTERALALVTEALTAAGYDAGGVRMTEVVTDEQALAVGFRGSPTIRIGGVDLVALAGADDPAAGEPAALTCRLYRHRDRAHLTDAGSSRCRRRDRGRMTLTPGAIAPAFTLPDTDGRDWSLQGGDGEATVVVFTCNHCPYAIAWHDRILDAARDYAGRGARFLLINSNDADRYPRDSLQAMRERIAGEQWPAPYLHDADQTVAHAFGAKTTPDVFVVDAAGILRYRGAPDADYGDPSQRAAWLRGALDAVIAGREPERSETKPVGCSIKWRP